MMTMMTMRTEPRDVIDYWFVELARLDELLAERMEFWFRRGEEVDEEVRERFGAAVRTAAVGGLASWLESDEGWLAFIVLIDQFPRNIHRGHAQAYALDELALATALEGMRHDRDLRLPVAARPYIYLPLMHAEDLELQKKSLFLARELEDQATPAQLEFLKIYCESAQEHYDLIARFGRYPHRNEVLGRTSTPEELAFLSESDFLQRV